MELADELVDVDDLSIALAWHIVQDHLKGGCEVCGVECDRVSWAHGVLERLDTPRPWYSELVVANRKLMRAVEAGHVLVVSPGAGLPRG